jgi:hypothetical protein
MENEAHVIFLNLLAVYSSCKWKFVACSLVDKETNGSYPFANKLNDYMDYTDLPIY